MLQIYADENTFRIVKVFEEVETAKRAGRKKFQEMIQFLQLNHDVKDILVEKTDRLYRNFFDWTKLDVDQMDIRIHLVKEHVILSKDSRSNEKFIHGIKVLMAKNYIDNLSEEVRKGQTEKALQGTWPSVAPVGYLNKLDDHSIVVDPVIGQMIKRAFELAKTGQYSLNKLRKWLYEQGFRSKRAKKEPSKSAMSTILKNRFYYGEFSWKNKIYQGKHEPPVSQRTWHTSLGDKNFFYYE